MFDRFDDVLSVQTGNMAFGVMRQAEAPGVPLGGFDDHGRLGMTLEKMQIAIDAVGAHFHRFQPAEAGFDRPFERPLERRFAPVGVVQIDANSLVQAGRFAQGLVAVLAAVSRSSSQHAHAADDPRVAIDRMCVAECDFEKGCEHCLIDPFSSEAQPSLFLSVVSCQLSVVGPAPWATSAS